MKNILYSFLILILVSHYSFAQTLMSDEDHRIMMNDYAVHLDSILNIEIPQGITIDQFKKKIVNGELTLSSTAQASILTYAEPLKNYGAQFATAKNLTATTDSEKIFLSSFAPSTLIDSSGNLVESNATLGLTAIQMWTCAIETFDSIGCSPFGVIGGNKGNINLLLKTFTSKLTSIAGVLGVAITVGDYEYCLFMHSNPFEVISEQYINFNDSLITNFFNQTLYYDTNHDVQFITEETKLLILKNGYKVIAFKVISDEFNFIYAFFNVEKNEFIYLNVNSSNNNVDVLSPTREGLITYSRLNGNVSIRRPATFTRCMAAVQRDFENTTEGWLAWNLNPLNQITAAAVCQACVKGWKRICPKVYQVK